MKKALAIAKTLTLYSVRHMLSFPIARRILYTKYERPAVIAVILVSLAIAFTLGYAYGANLFINPWEQNTLIDFILASIFILMLLIFVLSPIRGPSLPQGYEFLLHQPVDLWEIALGVMLGATAQGILVGIFIVFVPLVITFAGAVLGLLPEPPTYITSAILMFIYVATLCILLASDLELLRAWASRRGRRYVVLLAQAVVLVYVFAGLAHSIALSLDLGFPTVSPILSLPPRIFYVAAYELSRFIGFVSYFLGLAAMLGIHYPLARYLGRSLGIEDFVSIKDIYETMLLKHLEKEVKRRPLASWSSPEDALRQVLVDISPLNPRNKLKHYTIAFATATSVALILRLLATEGVLALGGFPENFVGMVTGFSVLYIYAPLVNELLFNDLRSLWLVKVYSCSDLPFVKILNIKYLSYLGIALTILSLFKAIALGDPYLLLLPVLNLPLLCLSTNMLIVFGARYLRKHRGKLPTYAGTPSTTSPDIYLAILMMPTVLPIVGQTLFTSMIIHRILSNNNLAIALTLCVTTSAILTTKLAKLIANWLTKAELY